MLTRNIRVAIGGLALVSTASMTGAVIGTAQATVADAPTASVAAPASVSGAAVSARKARAKTVDGRLTALNNSGVDGDVSVKVKGRKATVTVKATGLARNLPHAAHFHFSAEASHRCPTNAQDSNGDGRLNVAEGVPVYGAIVKSLTTKGDSSPASALAVDRFPTTPKGKEVYKRTIKVKKAVANALRRGNVVVVLHGVDFNSNGQYDFDSAGASEIAPSLPAEATDPAACGVLK